MIFRMIREYIFTPVCFPLYCRTEVPAENILTHTLEIISTQKLRETTQRGEVEKKYFFFSMIGKTTFFVYLIISY